MMLCNTVVVENTPANRGWNVIWNYLHK